METKMTSKSQQLINTCQSHIGEWCCSYCATKSGQPAAIFRTVKAQGYEFEKVSTNRWGKKIYCPKCGMNRTHYKMISSEINQENVKGRSTSLVNPRIRKRVFGILGNEDVYTGKSTNEPTIDHKTPFIRLKKDFDINKMSDQEIKENFQVMSFTNNLIKNNACMQCVRTGKRQPLYGINFFYKGDETYRGTCEGCGYHDCKKWKEELQSKYQQPSQTTSSRIISLDFIEDKIVGIYSSIEEASIKTGISELEIKKSINRKQNKRVWDQKTDRLISFHFEDGLFGFKSPKKVSVYNHKTKKVNTYSSMQVAAFEIGFSCQTGWKRAHENSSKPIKTKKGELISVKYID